MAVMLGVSLAYEEVWSCRAQGLSILSPEASSPLPPIVDTGWLLSKKPKQCRYLGQAQGVGPKESRGRSLSVPNRLPNAKIRVHSYLYPKQGQMSLTVSPNLVGTLAKSFSG